MIIRIEIDGFKSFDKFMLDLKPFTVLAGPNNSGKSNVLEAIELVRDLELEPNGKALVGRARGTGVQLFHRTDDGTSQAYFEINVEVEVSDQHIEWPLHVRVGPSSNAHRAFDVETSTVYAGVSVEEHADLARWLSSWTLVSPDAAKMRRGASLNDAYPLADSGSNMAAVIGRIFDHAGGDEFILDAQFVIGDLLAIEPIRDTRRNQWDFDVVMRGGRSFTPTLVSDGTLRILALLAALHDPDHCGVVMIEDVENGLHPEYQARLCDRLAARTGESGRQVIATTHSPIVVSATLGQADSAVVFLDQVTGPVKTDDGVRRTQHQTRARLVADGGERGTYVTQTELRNYLSTASGR